MPFATFLSRWGFVVRDRALAIGVAALVALQGFSLFSLARVHPVWGDEGSYSDVAMSFARRGTFAWPFMTGDYGFERSNVAFGRLYTGALGLVYRTIGFGVFQGRLLSYMCGIAILALVYLIVRELQGSRVAAVWASVLVAASYIFFDTTHTIRPEIALTALATCSLYVLLVARRRDSWWLYALAGLLGAACADVHSNGICVPVALVAVALWLLGWRRTLTRAALPFGLGVAAGAAWWVGVHILPDPALFSWQWRFWSGYALPPAVQIVRNPAAWAVAEWAKLTEAGTVNAAIVPLLAYWALFAIGAPALVWAWLQRERASSDPARSAEATLRRDALVPVIYLAGLTFAATLAVSQRLQPYYIYAVPMIVCTAVMAMASARRGVRWAIVVVASIAVALSVGAVGYTSWKLRGADYGRFVSQVRRYVPDGVRVFGWQDLRFAFEGDQLRGYTGELYDRAPSGGYLVIGEDLATASAANDPRLKAIITERGVLVGTVSDSVYGRNVSSSPRLPSYRTFVYRLR
ncbi:MAG: glycosyltransferase family 39 protein [Coriobacteriia bacterium]|nr:glycosyltransferase family 39 protein [Coriobacteriia bacterium]